ncbi:MAG: flavin reductase, partial [Ruminiclostridium sp.]
THASYIVAEAFRYSHIVFASTTYNAGIFVKMEDLLHDLAAHNIQNRTVAFVENGSWAATSGKLMKEILSGCKNMTFIEETVSLRSALKPEQQADIEALADRIALDFGAGETAAKAETGINTAALFKIPYGLYLLTAKDGKDNGCIVNVVQLITDNPKRIAIAVNKQNLTHDMILKTGVFNVSILTESVPMDTIKHFGFQSGKDVDKFADINAPRTANGIVYLGENTNAVISAKVISAADNGTHTLFTAEVTAAEVLSDEPSVTYDYYQQHIKPKPRPAETKKKGFVCTVCGYVYEGDELPADFVCPLCKHGAEEFEPLED